MEDILGNRLPVELQRKIFLYMEHPTSEIIKKHRNDMYNEVIEDYVLLETRRRCQENLDLDWDDEDGYNADLWDDEDEETEITYDDLVKWDTPRYNFLEDIEYHNLIRRNLIWAWAGLR